MHILKQSNVFIFIISTIVLMVLAFSLPLISKAAPQPSCNVSQFFAVTDTSGKAITTFSESQLGQIEVILYMKLTFSDKDVCDLDNLQSWMKPSQYGFDMVLDGNAQFVGNGQLTKRAPTLTEWEIKARVASFQFRDAQGNVPKQGSKVQFRGFVNLFDTFDGYKYSSPATLSITSGAAPTPGGNNTNTGNGNGGGSGGGNPNGNGGGTTDGDGNPIVSISNPISYNSLGELIVAIIKFLLTMIGALAVLFIIIGAVRMTVSAGNESAVKAGKATVTWAVIGLVVALLAFSLIGLVQNLVGRN